MRFITVFLLFQHSDRQDLDRCRFRFVTELSGRVEPGQASHIEVEQDQRRQDVTRGGDTIYPVIRCLDGEASALEEGTQIQKDIRVVVDDENFAEGQAANPYVTAAAASDISMVDRNLPFYYRNPNCRIA